MKDEKDCVLWRFTAWSVGIEKGTLKKIFTVKRWSSFESQVMWDLAECVTKSSVHHSQRALNVKYCFSCKVFIGCCCARWFVSVSQTQRLVRSSASAERCTVLQTSQFPRVHWIISAVWAMFWGFTWHKHPKHTAWTCSALYNITVEILLNLNELTHSLCAEQSSCGRMICSAHPYDESL